MAEKEIDAAAAATDEVAPGAEPAAGPEDVKARFRAALEAKHAAQHPDADGSRKGGGAGPHGTSGAHTKRVFRRKSGG